MHRPASAPEELKVFARARGLRLSAAGWLASAAALASACWVAARWWLPAAASALAACLWLCKRGCDLFVEAALSTPGRRERRQVLASKVTAKAWGAARYVAPVAFAAPAAALLYCAVWSPVPQLARDFSLPFWLQPASALLSTACLAACVLSGGRVVASCDRRRSFWSNDALWWEGRRAQELSVARALAALPGGWHVRYGVPYPPRRPAAAVVSAPSRTGYAVEVEPAAGTVVASWGAAGPRVRLADGDFGGDPVVRASLLAALVCRDGDYEEVVPVVCFTRARLSPATPRVLGGVHLVEPGGLARLLCGHEEYLEDETLVSPVVGARC